MFIGHFGLALGAKKAAPAVSLGALFAACQLADLLWPTFLLLGYERVAIQPGATAFTPLDFISYPYSHSLAALCGWAIGFGALYLMLRRKRLSAFVTIAVLVISHWLLDYVTHRPDMPLTPSGRLYLRATTARDRIGSAGFWTLIGFLLVVYLGNAFGPPPPSVAALAWSAQAIWLLVAWGYWVDNHRIPHRN